jgi:hypothetical protein
VQGEIDDREKELVAEREQMSFKLKQIDRNAEV